MDLDFSLDFESQQIKLTIDNSTTVTGLKDADSKIVFKRFDNIESEELQSKIKQVMKILFSIEDL